MSNNFSYAYAGGAVGPNQIYVPREVDDQLTELLLSKRTLVNLRAPRQSGKSSLAQRLIAAMREAGHRVVFADLRSVVGTVDDHSNTADKWYGLLFRHIARELGVLPAEVNTWMRQWAGESPVNCIIEFYTILLRKHVSEPLLIVIDEIDYVMPHGYHTDHLFESLRQLFNKLDEHDMSFLLAGIFHPSQLVKASGSGTFNVGHDVVLRDFGTDDDTLDQWGMGLVEGADARGISRAIIEATGGQPFLTSVLHQDAANRSVSSAEEVGVLVGALLDDARQESRLVAHFENPEKIVEENTASAYEALEVFRRVRREPCESITVAKPLKILLQTSGLAREKNKSFEVRCPIYFEYFNDEWIDQQLKKVGYRRRSVPGRTHNGNRARPKVCIINSGGTLGMERQTDGTLAQPTDLRRFYSSVPELDEVADIEPLPLMCKDGINISPDDWRVLAEAIHARRDEGYAGFVISHGTDTMAFTAAAVAFAFGAALRTPIIMTGAQAPLDVLHGDARSNLIRATKLATEKIPEVCIAYSDKCFRGVRAQKNDDFRFEGFVSPTLEPLAVVTETIDINKAILRSVDQAERLRLRPQFDNRVVKLQVHPGLDPEFYHTLLDAAEIRGLVLETPGVGNIPLESQWSLIPLIRDAVGKGVPVLVTSQFPVKPETRGQYRPANAPLEAGAISAGNMTAPSALVKFMWAIAQTDRLLEAGEITDDERLAEIKAVMGRDIIGEVDLATTKAE